MNSAKKLHIISFDVPYPPDYGGVIDVFYKLKGLAKEGLKIYLHCFQYGRSKSSELENYCEQVFYYPRNTGLKYAFNKKPYIVAGRNHRDLLKNILKIKAPILFEGLHTCYFIDHPELKNYRKIIRAHNVEHDYYNELRKSERNFKKRIYYKKEAKKLKRYEAIIQHADLLVSISPSDQEYFQNKHKNAFYIPAFHEFETIQTVHGRGGYFLFHGNLSVSENIKSVIYLIDEVFNDLNIKLVVAGKNPSKELVSKISGSEKIKIIINPTREKMDELIKNAQACIIPTFQATGLKLKLLASLYNGRFCITNEAMVKNTGLEKLCIIADSASEMKKEIQKCLDKEFTKELILERARILDNLFSNEKGISKLTGQIYTEG